MSCNLKLNNVINGYFGRLSGVRRHAFSLIEVVLAVGVISFALVAIIGLFPVAMQSALDSQRETQVTFIARSLFSELQRVDDDKSYVTVTKPVASGERQTLDEGELVTIDLASGGATPTLFYFDEEGGMLDVAAGALYKADVTIDHTGQPAGLARVDIKIFVPADATAANQKSYEFVTLINYNIPAASPLIP